MTTPAHGVGALLGQPAARKESTRNLASPSAGAAHGGEGEDFRRAPLTVKHHFDLAGVRMRDSGDGREREEDSGGGAKHGGGLKTVLLVRSGTAGGASVDVVHSSISI